MLGFSDSSFESAQTVRPLSEADLVKNPGRNIQKRRTLI